MKSLKSFTMIMLLSLFPITLLAGSEWNNTENNPSENLEFSLSLNGSAVQSTDDFFTFGTLFDEATGSGNKFNFNAKFTGIYDGVCYTKGLKMEGSTVIEWLSTQPATVTIVQSAWNNSGMKTIKFDNIEQSIETATYNEANCYYEYVVENVPAGGHTITRGSGESGLFFVKVTYKAADSSDYSFDKQNAFGWGTCSDINGTPYQLDGGWHKEKPAYTILYASGGDDKQAIMDAIETFDIVVLDGLKGDFILSENMPLRNIKHKSILGRNNARLCTQWYITSDLRQALNDANVNQYRPDAGTGGYLSNGNWVDEAREQHTRQVIIDFTGDETEVYRNAGIFKLDSSDENIIIRNLTLVGPGSVDVGGTDIISNYGATNVWIDHCDFIDGLDGNLDSGYREGSNMFATYSWNIFRYTDRSYSHSNSNLTTKTKGFQQYVTYAYNIWGEGCYSRLPRIEGSDVHLLNNYYNCLNNSAAIAIVSNSRDLVEGNYAVDGIKNPFSGGNTDAQAYWLTRNNIGFGIFDNASNTDQQIEVPYPYVCFPTADVPTLLTGAKGAGPTLSYDDIVLPEGEPGIIEKTMFVIKAGDTFKSGQTITFEDITMTFGESGGPDFMAAIAQELDPNFTAFTPGNDVNGNKQGGTFYVFAPQEEGTLTVAVKHNGGKALYVEENGTVLPDFNGITLSETKHYTFSFPVKAGSTYKLYCSGSKLGFYGFIFKWVEQEEHFIDTFETAAEAVKNMKIGWNLFNTFESASANVNDMWIEHAYCENYETAFGNPVTKPELMKMLRKAGFNAIRIPVTWYPHTSGFRVTRTTIDGKEKTIWDKSTWDSYEIDPAWIKRLREVIDYVIDQGMYCIVNMHADGGSPTATSTAWFYADETNWEQIHERYEYIWRQIAEAFKDYDNHLLFEGYNELVDKWISWGDAYCVIGQNESIEQSIYNAVNKYAQSFVNAVRSTGGNNLFRNLIVNTYSGNHREKPVRNLKIPKDKVEGHIAAEFHCYLNGLDKNGDINDAELDKYIAIWKDALLDKGIPLVIGEWEPGVTKELYQKDKEKGLAYTRYFMQQARKNQYAVFNWAGPVTSGKLRSFPAILDEEHVKALMKGYYGDWYEPQMLTEDDYVYQKTKVNFYQRYARFCLCNALSLNDYRGIRIEIENLKSFDILIKNVEGKQQRKTISSSPFIVTFDRTILGDSISSIELQNMLNSKNETVIYHLYLIRNDGSEEEADIEAFKNSWECKSEDIYVRKQYVHSIDFNGLWTELNLFDDKIPMKLKTYKGLRVEFAEPVSADNYAIKVYGDDSSIALGKPVTTGLSTTISFSDYSVTNEVNRVTLQHIKDGHSEAKVICVWLIRQDGTEEFCDDLSPFWGCEVNNVTPYTTPIYNVNTDCTISNPGIYNLSGQRLSKPQKGINIIGGRKVFVN